MANVAAISASFHRNLSLLTKLSPPSDDFKKHFREGMFDKPNTAAFICVSHYLLTLYDAKRFKEIIDWPVNCKKSEANYRKGVREFLLKIAAENEDINFPTILASHLFHASGIKFIIIMWKLSQVVIRTCFKRKTGRDLMRMPKTGAANPTAIKLLKGINNSIKNENANRLKKLSELKEMSQIAIRKERESLAAVKAEIFDKEKQIEKCAEAAPVHPLLKKRLSDINDAEVIEMWKEHNKQGLEYIAKYNQSIKKIEDLTAKVHNVVTSNAERKTLDGKELEKIDLFTIPKFTRENAALVNGLYKENQLVLKSFFQLFNMLLEPAELCLKRRNLGDFTDCTRRIEEGQEFLKTVRSACLSILENLNELSSETRQAFEQQNTGDLNGSVSSPLMNSEILMPSPNINIDTKSHNYEGHDLQSRLALTPVEGAHMRLFSRYVPQIQTYQDSGVRLRPNMFLSRINLNDTMSSTDSQSSRSRKLAPKKFFFPKAVGSGRYTRLFSNQMNRSNRTINNDSSILLPCSSKANSTAIANAIGEIGDNSELSLDITFKSLCDISADVQAPQKPSEKHQEKPEDHIAKVQANHREIRETTEVEITTGGIRALEQPRQRRRSIGDLVERYKMLVEASKRAQNPQISVIPQEDE